MGGLATMDDFVFTGAKSEMLRQFAEIRVKNR
jgi:hypothetical protein